MEPGEIGEEAASDLITSTLVAVAQAPVLALPQSFLANVATGAYVAEIEARFTEFEANGWSTQGVPIVESASVIENSGGPPATATVEACIDSSAVVILDAAGESVGASTTPRAKNLFTLSQEPNGSWRITSRTFSDDPAC